MLFDVCKHLEDIIYVDFILSYSQADLRLTVLAQSFGRYGEVNIRICGV